MADIRKSRILYPDWEPGDDLPDRIENVLAEQQAEEFERRRIMKEKEDAEIAEAEWAELGPTDIIEAGELLAGRCHQCTATLPCSNHERKK